MFGITENGDASLNYEWLEKLDKVDGSILITKKITKRFKKEILARKDTHKFILHISCTGYGDSILEPNLDPYPVTIGWIRNLIDCGFPAERIVLRVDPIIPTDKGIRLFESVVKHARGAIPEVTRVRVSVLDMYPHVKERFAKRGVPCPYDDNFQASSAMFRKLNQSIESLKKSFPDLSFESCAETNLPAATPTGCVSPKDYEILGLKKPEDTRKGQRKACLCLGDKKDLLTFRKDKTGYDYCYGCLYCYWQTDGKPSAKK
jgi:hypothetical protein